MKTVYVIERAHEAKQWQRLPRVYYSKQQADKVCDALNRQGNHTGLRYRVVTVEME